MPTDVGPIFKTSKETQAVAATPQIPELQRQEDLCELKASLVYWLGQPLLWHPVSKHKTSCAVRLHPLGQLKSRLPLQHSKLHPGRGIAATLAV